MWLCWCCGARLHFSAAAHANLRFSKSKETIRCPATGEKQPETTIDCLNNTIALTVDSKDLKSVAAYLTTSANYSIITVRF